MSLEKLLDLTEEFFTKNNISEDHGFSHAYQVTANAVNATQGMINIPIKEIIAAAMLHDCDDSKLFKTKNFSNAKMLLINSGFTLLEMFLICEMISYVSASKSGNTKIYPEWKLIPRDCDRIEAIGEIGIQRCYEYTIGQKRPIVCENTPIVCNEEELLKLNIEDRFKKYVENGGHSDSMLDHIYDKLLNIGKMESGNKWLQERADTRLQIMKEHVFNLGRIRKSTQCLQNIKIMEKFW